jgi:tight adherence protein C
MQEMMALIIALSLSGAVLLAALPLVPLVYQRMLVRPARPARPRSWMEQIEPVLDRLPVPRYLRARWGDAQAQVKLQHAGLPWRAPQYAAFRWGSFWLALGLASWLVTARGVDLVSLFVALLLVAMGFLLPSIWTSWRVDRRRMEIDISLPDFMDRLALGLEAGLGFEVALRRAVARFPGLLGAELRRVLRQLDRGYGRSAALEELVVRNPSNDLRAFVAAVKQAERLGTSLAKSLRIQTELLRARRRRRAQEASRRLPILIVFPLVFCFLPALMIVYLAPPLLHLFLGQ